jgi:hypothetical protein
MTTYAPAQGTRPRVAVRATPLARLSITIAVIVGVVGMVVTIGADTGWLAALGGVIVRRGTIPTGVPFAAASTAHWSNTLVLAELILHALQSAFGATGLVVAQLVGVGAGLGLLAADAQAGGARPGSTAAALLLVALGAFSSLAVVRVQLFSLVLFPAMLALLRAEARNPSRRIWLALPLLALWSNLHGAALSGLAVLYAYLALSRVRHDRATAVGVALGALVALCLTPAGLHTIDYYHGLLTNLAAQRGAGQWAPLGASPFDFVYVAVAIVLAVRLRRERPELWELAVLIGLAALSVKAGRNGVWVLFVLLAPAARAARPGKGWDALLPAGAIVAVALLVLDAGHWPSVGRAADTAARRAIGLAHGTPILADGLLAEQVALEGGRIWAGNPIDAFSRTVQARYLDWLNGAPSGRAALADPAVEVVLVSGGSPDARLTARDPDFTRAATVGGDALYVRRARR